MSRVVYVGRDINIGRPFYVEVKDHARSKRVTCCVFAPKPTPAQVWPRPVNIRPNTPIRQTCCNNHRSWEWRHSVLFQSIYDTLVQIKWTRVNWTHPPPPTVAPPDIFHLGQYPLLKSLTWIHTDFFWLM